MRKKVAIVGIGCTVPRPTSPEVSYREMDYDAAVRAYADAGLRPADVDSFVTCLEDLCEGTSIADEYTPDQFGGMLKPMCTVGGDGLHGIADAFLRIQSGISDTVLVASRSKASNIKTPHHLLNYALDPVWNRPLGLNPHYIAGLEMSAYLAETGTREEQCAAVAAGNRTWALRNDLAPHAAAQTVQDVMRSSPLFSPLKGLEMSATSDASFAVILTTEQRARKSKGSKPIWVRGVGWSNDTPTLESRPWARARYAENAAAMALKMAGIRNPRKQIDLFEIDDTYAYKELQHLEAAGVFKKGEAGKMVGKGVAGPDGDVIVNRSGGSLGAGHMLDATGLFRLVELVRQIRGEAGRHQAGGRPRSGMALSWRGVPTTSGAAVVVAG
jgi:acetyl-CoA C-acetyltransferase